MIVSSSGDATDKWWHQEEMVAEERLADLFVENLRINLSGTNVKNVVVPVHSFCEGQTTGTRLMSKQATASRIDKQIRWLGSQEIWNYSIVFARSLLLQVMPTRKKRIVNTIPILPTLSPLC